MGKLTPIIQFALIFLSWLGLVMGGGYIFIGLIGNNFLIAIMGFLLIFIGIASALRLFGEG